MMTGELASAILQRGGRELDDLAQRRGPVSLGEATHTIAGNLPFRYIIHAAIIGLHAPDTVREKQSGTFTSGRILSEATLNSLDQAHILAVESLGIPPLGVEKADFPLDQCADIMLGEVHAFAAANPEATLHRVVIVCPDENSFAVFHNKTIQRKAS
jgi:O-acetyl-ADP-ribose deacetylase (regulator of RNase III)